MRLNRIAAVLAAIAVLTMMVVGTSDIIATRFLGRPVPGAFELTEAMMVAAVFLSLAIAQADRRHVRVEILVDRLNPRGRAIFDFLAEFASLLVFGAIAWYGWHAGVTSTAIGEFSSGLIPFPVWPAKLCLAIGASLAAFQSAIGSLTHFNAALRRSPARES